MTTKTTGAVASMTVREWRVLLAAIPRRSIKPVLAECHVGADGTVSVTDLAVSVQRRGDGRGGADLEGFTAPRRVLEALLKGRGVRSVVQLADTGGTGLEASVDGRAIGSRERGVDPAKCPTLEVVETGDDVFRVPCVRTWAARLEAAAVHAGERTRWAMNGVHLQVGPSIRGRSAVRVCATDGKRLAVEAMAVTAERWGVDAVGEPTSGWIVDLGWIKAVGRVARILGAGVEGIVRADANRTTLEAEEWVITGRNVEGQFPPIASVIPQQPGDVASFRAGGLLEALSVCETTCNEEGRSVRLEPRAEGHIWMTSRSVDLGESLVDVDGARAAVQPGGWVSYDPRFIRDAVAFLGAGEDDVVDVRAARSAIRAMGSGLDQATTWTLDARPERLALVMPVTLRTGGAS